MLEERATAVPQTAPTHGPHAAHSCTTRPASAASHRRAVVVAEGVTVVVMAMALRAMTVALALNRRRCARRTQRSARSLLAVLVIACCCGLRALPTAQRNALPLCGGSCSCGNAPKGDERWRKMREDAPFAAATIFWFGVGLGEARASGQKALGQQRAWSRAKAAKPPCLLWRPCHSHYVHAMSVTSLPARSARRQPSRRAMGACR